jgi:hypothetical protein
VGSASAQSQSTDIRPNAQRVMGKALKAEFSGIRHEGAYNFNLQGVSQNRYTEMHYKDGKVLYQEGERQNKGAWLVYDDTLCFVYENALMSGGCFRVYKVENCYYYYSDQIVERKDELDREYWTARSVKAGQTPQCDAAIS